MPRLALLAVLLTGVLTAMPSAFAGDGSWRWPVDGIGAAAPAVVGKFDRPESVYGPGHRGIDLMTLVGAPVRAVAAGVVTFAGPVAGIDVVSIDHGAERSTYQPVSAAVSVGDRVDAGDVIGTVVVGQFHCASPCLHLGRVAQAGATYLDPLHRLGGQTRIRLVDPKGPPPVPPAWSSAVVRCQRDQASPARGSGPGCHRRLPASSR